MNSTCNRFIFSVNTNTYSKIWGKQSSVSLSDSSLCPMTFTMFHLLGIYHIQHIIYSIYILPKMIRISIYTYHLNVNWNAQTRIDTWHFKQRRPFQKETAWKPKKNVKIYYARCYKSMAKKNPPSISTYTHASSFRSNKLLTIVKFPLWFYYLFYYIIFFRYYFVYFFIYLFIFTAWALLLFIKWDFIIDYAWRIVNVLVIMASPI